MTKSRFRPVKQLKMTVRTSFLWKINTHMAKKWPEKVVQRSFIKELSFPISLYVGTRCNYFSFFMNGLLNSKQQNEIIKIKFTNNWNLYSYSQFFLYNSLKMQKCSCNFTNLDVKGLAGLPYYGIPVGFRLYANLPNMPQDSMSIV